jgi:membrane-associated protein
MIPATIDFLRHLLVEYGYWAVALALLLENAGLPVPGETMLLLASFLAYSEHKLHLPYIMITAIVAATLGDNIGFLIGHHGGRPLLDRYRHMFRIPSRVVARGERLFARYGAVTIFFARFIFGMRVIAGPLAGVLRMPWVRFSFFNFLGASVWVVVISTVGYLFGQHWDELVRILRRVNLAILIAVAIAVIAVWLWRRFGERDGD